MILNTIYEWQLWQFVCKQRQLFSCFLHNIASVWPEILIIKTKKEWISSVCEEWSCSKIETIFVLRLLSRHWDFLSLRQFICVWCVHLWHWRHKQTVQFVHNAHILVYRMLMQYARFLVKLSVQAHLWIQ